MWYSKVALKNIAHEQFGLRAPVPVKRGQDFQGRGQKSPTNFTLRLSSPVIETGHDQLL